MAASTRRLSKPLIDELQAHLTPGRRLSLAGGGDTLGAVVPGARPHRKATISFAAAGTAADTSAGMLVVDEGNSEQQQHHDEQHGDDSSESRSGSESSGSGSGSSVSDGTESGDGDVDTLEHTTGGAAATAAAADDKRQSFAQSRHSSYLSGGGGGGSTNPSRLPSFYGGAGGSQKKRSTGPQSPREPPNELRRAVDLNVANVETMLTQMAAVMTNTKKVNQALHIYRNQEVILKQTCEYESTTLSQLLNELHATQHECNEVKRKMKAERMQTVASLNDELYEAEAKLVQLREENTALDATIAELDAEFVLLEQQLLLTDAKWIKEEHKRRKREKKLRLKQGDGVDDTVTVTTQSLLTNEKLFQLLTSLPSDEKVDAFIHEADELRPTEPRVLRILGDFMTKNK